MHLLLQFVPDSNRELLQDWQIICLQALASSYAFLTHKKPNASSQAVGDGVLSKVTPNLSVSGYCLRIDVPDVRRCIGDTADERGDEAKGTDDHTHIEGTLVHVFRENLHGCGRELRQRPMERCEVRVTQAAVALFDQMFICPSPVSRWIWQARDAIPEASNVVVQDNDQKDKPQQPNDLQNVFGVDPGHHVCSLFAHLDKAQQARDPHDS
mmetsp:Transcript_74205/g.172115  ORF Transcript_74205/g.172115 Transcript_74205/m.172115 type:complete len:211 (+) Transcript_74205:771-1403(+)